MTAVHSILESLFFLSGIALAVLAGIGLRQLTVAKEIARTDATRDSLKLAAEQCAHYNHHIIPMIDALTHAVEANNIVFYDKSQVEVKADKVKVTSTAMPEDIRALIQVGTEFLTLFNAMDAFAIFFLAGVADEKLAFSAVGTHYCQIVRRHLSHLMIHKGGFDNVLQLFFLWNGRLESLRLQMERQEIENNLQKIQNKFIKPVGT